MPIHVNTTQAQATLRTMARRLSKENMALATARAINHTAAKANTQAKRAILEKYNLHKTQVQEKKLRIQKASRNDLRGALLGYARPIALISFTGTHQTKAGVRVTAIRGQKKLIRRSFIAHGKGGNRGVFARGKYVSKGKFEFSDDNRAKITWLDGVNIAATGESAEVQGCVDSVVHNSYTSRLIHEMQRIANGNTP